MADAAIRSGRRPQDVLLVAVTKTATPDQIRSLVEMGHVDFGENRVQQLVQRVATLDEFIGRKRFLGRAISKVPAGSEGGDAADVPTVRWHMIGHLQRNKVKLVVPLVRLIHSIDSLRLAEELHAYGARLADRAGDDAPEPIDILLQVNASGEESKYGLAVPAVAHMAEQVDTMIHLRLRGLMTMAPYSDDPEISRGCFARTAELFHELRTMSFAGNACNILSMGMTNDYEVAVEQGANLIRVGRAIFGENEG